MYTILQQTLADFKGIYPELILVSTFLVLIGIDLIQKKNQSKLFPIVFLIGVLTNALVAIIVGMYSPSSSLLFNSLIKSDEFSTYLKLLFSTASIFTIGLVSFSRQFTVKGKQEFFYLLLSIQLGLHFLVMSVNFFSLLVSLELVSIGSYILTVFTFDKKGAEAGIKYSLFGAFSTGIMLFGISILYGATGGFAFMDETSHLLSTPGVGNLVVVGVLLACAGLLFKISAFPFHIWAPDVYQGGPLPFVAYLSVAPKIAALAVLYRVIHPLLGIHEVGEILTSVLAVLAIVTLSIGNLAALVQTDLKRMFAYSSIAHAGFILLAIICIKGNITTAIFFYFTIYLFMNFSSFGLLDLFLGKKDEAHVNNFSGLGLKIPLLGGIFVLTMISLTGLPPTAGFYAKLFVFSVLWETYQFTGNQVYIYLLGAGLINTVISLFYYLRIPYFLYFKKNETATFLTSPPLRGYIIIALISLPLIVLFFTPNWILSILGNFKL